MTGRQLLIDVKVTGACMQLVPTTQMCSERIELFLEKFYKGAQGEIGPQGPQGLQGEIGPQGNDGASAYEQYVSGGGTLSEAEFIAMLNDVPDHMADTDIHVTTTDKSNWNSKQNELGFTPEDVNNKKTTLTDFDTDYPTCKAVNTGLGLRQLKNLVFTNISASSWVSDTTYTDYGYKCELICSGVTSTDIAEVIFAHTQAVSGNYSPVCLTSTDRVTIYSKVNTSITIPTIIVNKV